MAGRKDISTTRTAVPVRRDLMRTSARAGLYETCTLKRCRREAGLRGLHPLDVAEILSPTSRTFVPDKGGSPDEIDVHISERTPHPFGPGLHEAQARQLRQNVNATRRNADLIRHALAAEIVNRDVC